MIDAYGNELIKYEILNVLSVEECTAQFSTEDDEASCFLKCECMVKSEYGEITGQTTYWEKEEWEVNVKRGYYFMQDAFSV